MQSVNTNDDKRPRRIYLVYKIDTEVQIDFYSNPMTQLEYRATAKCVYQSDYDPSVYVFAVDLPDSNFLLDRNTFIFELAYCPQPLVVVSYFSERFIYTKGEEKDFFVLSLKFRRNERNMQYKEPPGEAIEDPVRELVHFFSYVNSNFFHVQTQLNKIGKANEINTYFNYSLQSLSDLISQFKKTSGNSLTSNGKLLGDFVSYMDDLILQAVNSRANETLIFLVSLFGVFNSDFFISRDSQSKNANLLLNLASGDDVYARFTSNFSSVAGGKSPVRDYLTNGFYSLINLAIKDGASWLKVTENKTVISLFESEVDFYRKVNDYIKKSGVGMRREDAFQDTKTYLLKFYLQNADKFEEKENMTNSLLRNIAIISNDKETLLQTMFDFNESNKNSLVLDAEKVRLLKEEVKRKKWGNDSNTNLGKYITTFDGIIKTSTNLKDEFKNVLYEMSYTVKYLFTLLKTVKVDTLLFKKAFYNIYEMTLEDFAIVISDLAVLDSYQMKKDILDSSFYERIKICLKKVVMPFEERQKQFLQILLLDLEVFPNGSLDFLKDFIKEKPKLDDLIFLCRDIVYPQKARNSEKKFFDLWLNIRNNLVNTYVEIPELVKSFSLLLSSLPNDEFKTIFCEEVWKTLFQKYSNEVFFSISHMFNTEENIDECFIRAYILWVNLQISTIPLESNAMYDRINLFFSALSGTNENNERVLFSNNTHTESIVISLLNFLSKNSDSKKVVKSFMFENPSTHSFWYKIIKSYGGNIRTILSHDWVVDLNNLIRETSTSVISGDATVLDFILISKQKDIQRDALLAYFAHLESKETNQEALDSQLDILNSNLNIVSSLEIFFKDYGTHILNANDFVIYLSKLKEDFKVTPFKQFWIREDLLKLKDEVSLVNQWSQTFIFRNVLETEVTEKGTIDHILTLCRKTEDNIRSTVKSLITEDLSKITLSTAKKLFKGLESFNKEADIISRIVELKSEEKATLISLLQTFCQINNYIRFCHSFLKLDSLYKFTSSNVSVYSEFLSLASNVESSFDKIFTFSKRLGEIRVSYLGKRDIENILHELAEDFDLTSFLLNTPEEDIRNMVDAVDEHGDSFIRVQTIRDLLILGSFVKSLHLKDWLNDDISTHPSEEEFVKRIVDTMERPSYNGIDVLLNSSMQQYLGIKHLHQELSNREEASKIKARDICKHSYFNYYFNVNLNTYEVDIKYGRSQKKINYRDLGDLRDRVLLLLYNEANGDGEHSSEFKTLLAAFIKTVELSDKILFILNDVYYNGFPDRLSQKVEMEEGNYSVFETYLEQITEINNRWNEDLKEAYIRFYPLTYFNGNQFWSLEELFMSAAKGEEVQNSTGFYLLKYADPSITVDELNSRIKEYMQEEGQTSTKERIMRLGYLISKVINPSTNTKRIPNLRKVPLNLGNNHFIYSCPTNLRIYTYLLSIYFSVEEALPNANSIFYCRKDTTFHELVSFLYRFIHSPVNRLFTLIRVENLAFSLQNFLVAQVNKLTKNKNLLGTLSIICCDVWSTLSSQFSSDSSIYCLRDFDVLDEMLISEVLRGLDLNAYIVRSDDTGAGKTFFIRSKFQELVTKDASYKYLDFPILDVINMNRITERLFKLNQYEKRFLHVTICGIIDDYEMLDYILFSLLIVGCIKHGSFVNFRGSKDPLYIEIANTYNDYLYSSISVMGLLPHGEVINACDNLQNIVTKPEIKDPLQIVTNYLYNYDKDYLNETDIVPEVEMNTRIFPREDCLSYLDKYFIKGSNAVTFRQVQIFLSVMNDQLVKFSNNYFFSCENLGYINDDNLKDIRQRIMQCLLLMTEEFTTRSIKAAREQQAMSVFKLKRSVSREDMYDDETKQEEHDALKDILSWSSSNHLIIMFHEDGMCVTPVYREAAKVPEAVADLAESQRQTLEDYQVFSHFELLEKLTNIVGRQFDLDNLAKKQDYILTADNFLKMLLIIIRARCNVPIVIMGETGCGKTSLVRFLTTEIMKEGFEVINFHAGIKEHHIIEKMNEIVTRAEILKVTDNKIWVFLDEINTCDCMGLITELICHRTCLGEPLPDNIVFIAACNPYRIRKNVSSDVGLVKQRVMTRLVYTVHPLPDALIDYVWDYGSLSENEERLYIGNILSSISGEIKKVSIEAVCRSQMFIRKCEDKYSVSLRDVARFKILHEWFYKTLLEKNEKKTKEAKLKSNYSQTTIKFNGALMVSRKALILSLVLCYLYRISKNADRSAYKVAISELVGITSNELDEMINEEQRDIVTRMDLPPAIAINKALLENVFTLLVCVVNKIPLFICGKPGCSKSLSIQLLVSNLRGADSHDPFFKTLPRILAIPYQGSETSTSEGIEKIFEKAYNVLNDNSSDSILPLVVFDEIGLAEISKNNPLKILHSLLEPEKATVAFVGISNWRLDASKMNRAVYLARPDPDLEDLENTALAIFDYYIKDPKQEEKNLMRALASTYYEFKKDGGSQGDFHGTRDFYSLVKGVTKSLNEESKKENFDPMQIVLTSLCRNFGGLKDSHDRILSIFSRQFNYEVNYEANVVDLVKANLSDRESRFLLLFSKGESASYILDNYLRTDTRDRVFMIGSQFESDKDKDEHSFRLLSDIILYMEGGNSIVLKNLDQVYGSLYDLFNQNFMIVGGKKNCRIALGSTNNPMCFVNDLFHCVVIVDVKDLDMVDPPFLNRFEKQILTFDSVLNSKQKALVKELNSWVRMITSVEGVSNIIEDLIPTYSDDMSDALVLKHNQASLQDEEILRRCKKDILSLSSLSMIIYSVLSKMYATSRDEVLKAHKVFFEEQNHDSLSGYLNNLTNKFDNKLVVYTHSNILEELNLPSATRMNYINIAEIKSEKEFELKFKDFLQSDECEWLGIKFDSREKNHIPMIKYKVDKLMAEVKRNRPDKIKNVIMLVYLSRRVGKKGEKSATGNSLTSSLSGWEGVTIDSLNGGQIETLKTLLHLSTLELVKNNLDAKLIAAMVFNIYSKISFNTYNQNDSNLVKFYLTETIHKIESDENIFQIIYKKCMSYLEEKELGDWKVKIFSEAKILSKSSDTLSAIKAVIENIVEEPLLKIIYYLESESAMNSYFYSGSEEKARVFKLLWAEKLNDKNLNEVYTYNVTQSLNVNCVFYLTFPFSRPDIYNVAIGLQEHVEKIYVLDNAAYYSELLDEEIKLQFENEMEVIKKIVQSSSLFKVTNYDRALESAYISDLVNYFLTVELKKESKWKTSLDLIVSKFIGFDVENLELIYIFLWENRKFLESLINVFNGLCETFTVSFIENVLSDDKLFHQADKTNLKLRKEATVNTFLNIFNHFAKILLSQLGGFDLSEESKITTTTYGLIINTFISSLMNISLEVKQSPDALNILIVINEYLKTLTSLYKHDKEKIESLVKGLFPNEHFESDGISLKDFSVLGRILLSVDEGYADLLTRQKNPENFIKPAFVKNMKKEIISSKLTMFENVIQGNCDSKIRLMIVHNILQDEDLCSYSSMIFHLLFKQEDKNDQSLSHILNSDLKVVIDDFLSFNNVPLNSVICSFFSDFFRKYLHSPTKAETNSYLFNNLTNFDKFFTLISSNSLYNKIVGYAGLKHYLDIYGRYLADDSIEKDFSILNKVNSSLQSQEIQVEMLRNFTLKSMAAFYGGTANTLVNVDYEKLQIHWANNKLFENNDNALGIEPNLPNFEKLNKEYSLFFVSLLNDENEENITKFKNMILNAQSTPEIKFIIIQFFINKVWLNFSHPKYLSSYSYEFVQKLFTRVGDEIKSSLGVVTYNLISGLILNFPNEKHLCINPTTDTNRIGMMTLAMQMLNMLLSFGRSMCVGKLFFDEKGEIYKNLHHWNSVYLPAGFVEYSDENLLVMMKHIDENYEIYGTQIGLYECECGFLYTIGDCTRPYYVSQCPNCTRNIGGTGHVLMQGHKNLINADNRNEPNRKKWVIDYLGTKLKNNPGYVAKMADELSMHYSIRSLSSIGFRFLSYFNHSVIYLLTVLGGIEEDSLKNIISIRGINVNPKDYLIKHMNTDVAKLTELIKSKEWYIFLHVIFNEFLTLSKDPFKFDSAIEREKFEIAFQTKIIAPKLDKLAGAISEYKHFFNNEKKLTYSSIINENFSEEEIMTLTNYHLFRIFRYSRLGDWEDLKTEFKKKKVPFQFLKLLIEKFDEITNLSQCLQPVISFTNYLLEKCNFKFSRAEAKEKKLREVIECDKKAENLFVSFAEAWEKIAYKATQWNCKSLPVLESINLDIPLSFVLIDDRELGYGMYMSAALQHLGRVQNEVLEAIVYLIKENNDYQLWGNMDTHKYPIQKVSPHEIIMCDKGYIKTMTETFSKFYDIFNANYGQGVIVEYNFEKIENDLAFQLLTNKKFLDTENLTKIQYKFELLSIQGKHSNLLSEIKSKLNCQKFSEEDYRELNRFLEKMESQNVASLHSVFSSLEIILCNLRYTFESINSSNTINDYLSKMSGGDKITEFIKGSRLGEIKLVNILNFYQLVEEKLFKYIVEFISPEYNVDLNEETKETIMTFLNSGGDRNYLTLLLRNVVQRFIIRCLVSNLEAKFPVKEYLMRVDFWDDGVDEEVIDNFYNEFSYDVLISNTLPLQRLLAESLQKDGDSLDFSGIQKMRRDDFLRNNKFT